MACGASVAVGSRGKGESFKASSPGGGVDWGVPIVAEGPCGSGPSTGSGQASAARSEEHTSELQSLMRISYAVFCLKKKPKQKHPLKPQKHNRLIKHTNIARK